MHIKTLTIRTEDIVIFADLQFQRSKEGLGVQVRVTRTKKRNGERFIGIAQVSSTGKLVNRPTEISDKEAAWIEEEILNAIDGESIKPRKGHDDAI